MRRPYNIERRGICVPAARWIGQCLGYSRRHSHVKRFADAFEALAVARFAFAGEKGMGTIHLDGPGAILHMIFAKELHLIVVHAVHRRGNELLSVVVNDAERLLLSLFLRRYVTWCARREDTGERPLSGTRRYDRWWPVRDLCRPVQKVRIRGVAAVSGDKLNGSKGS